MRDFLTANETHFICGGKYCPVPRLKNAPSNAKENQTMPSWQELVLHSPGKKGLSDSQNLIRSTLIHAELVFHLKFFNDCFVSVA